MGTLFAALLAATLFGLSASPLRAETLDEIYARAKGEGRAVDLWRWPDAAL
jgi:hypothetical protein